MGVSRLQFEMWLVDRDLAKGLNTPALGRITWDVVVLRLRVWTCVRVRIRVLMRMCKYTHMLYPDEVREREQRDQYLLQY